MIPPKYNFYIGKTSDRAFFTKNTSIADSGLIYKNAGLNDYATGLVSLKKQECVFVNLISTVKHNAIFFYDKLGKYISYNSLIDINDTVIVPPNNAEHFAIRFTAEDANFDLKKDTPFVYITKKVNPHFKELNKKYAKESGQEFFRISLDGKINLFGDDYTIVNNASLENGLIFIIDKYNEESNKWFNYYKGEFNKTDCSFDHTKSRCELKTTAIDSYSEIMNKYDNTYDLIKLAPELSKVYLHKRSLMQVYIRGANSITNFFGGTYWEDDVNEAIDSHSDLINKYYFSYVDAGNEFYIKDAAISEVNGVYAGTKGYWTCWNGYTCYLNIKAAGERNYIYLKRNSDNKILYRSVKQWTSNYADIIAINREDVEMVNVSNSADKFTIKSPFVYHIYRRLLCDVDTVEDAEGVKNTYDLPANDFVANNRNYKKCIGLKGGLYFCTSKAVDEPTKYGLNDYNQYFTNKFIPAITGLRRVLPISRNSWANASLWYTYDIQYKVLEEKLRKRYMLKDSYSIGAAIRAILKKIDPSIKHESTAEYSQFLYGDKNPIGLTKFHVYIAQKTNILKGNYDQPAQKAEITFEELMKMLRDCFRCYWYIEDNKLKIEHISFFMNGGRYSGSNSIQLDFLPLLDKFNKNSPLFCQNEIEFDKTELNARYEFTWMDDATELFGGVTIDVDSSYIQKDKTEDINVGQFSSDVDYMLFSPNSFSNDGFALLCAVYDTSISTTIPVLPIVSVNNLIDENGNTYKAIIQNYYASWIFLQNCYLYDMPARTIKSNVLKNLQVYDLKKCMKHTIKFPSEEDLNPIGLIRTELGRGVIDEMSFNINTRQAKVNLVYNPR